MVWNKADIIKTLRKLNRAGVSLSYNALARKNQSLVSAAAYHFGSYRTAVDAAGIDYGDITRRPRWTRQLIIKLIKDAKRKGEDLHWSAVTKRRDDLSKAAFASLQPRLFGSWDRALHGAGLDADEVARYRKWGRDTIIVELRARAKDNERMNSGALQQENPGLHAAAVRHFGSYDEALRAAKLDPSQVRSRKKWDKAEVIKALKVFRRDSAKVTDTMIRGHNPSLFGAAIRLFGSIAAARSAAGLKPGPKPRLPYRY